MYLFLSVIIVTLASIYFFVGYLAQRKLSALQSQLPQAYAAAIYGTSGASALIPLSIDLMRKERSNAPFETLSPGERRMALHALAVERLPHWVAATAARRLAGQDRAIVHQLAQIKSSRPAKKERHFGAIQAQLQLQSSPET